VGGARRALRPISPTTGKSIGMIRIGDTAPSLAPALLERYRRITPAAMGHHVEGGILDPAIKPVQSGIAVVGPAVTVQCLGRDSAVCHKVVDLLRPGDILVIDRGGDRRYACWGEMMTLAAQLRGVAAVIVDGLATDVQFIRDCPMPVFCRGITPLTTQLLGHDGSINLPIQCGGVVIAPGDLICADDNGIAALGAGEAARLVELFEREEAGDAEFRDDLLAGKLPSELSGIDALIAANGGGH
jgi:4-hydroxy-4-methyl-2-oxoglutarate aldolase